MIFGITDDAAIDQLRQLNLQISDDSLDNALTLARYYMSINILSPIENGLIVHPLFETLLRREINNGFDINISLIKVINSLPPIQEVSNSGAFQYADRNRSGILIDAVTFIPIVGRAFSLEGRSYSAESIRNIILQASVKDPFTGLEISKSDIHRLKQELVEDGEAFLLALREHQGSPVSNNTATGRRLFVEESINNPYMTPPQRTNATILPNKPMKFNHR